MFWWFWPMPFFWTWIQQYILSPWLAPESRNLQRPFSLCRISRDHLPASKPYIGWFSLQWKAHKFMPPSSPTEISNLLPSRLYSICKALENSKQIQRAARVTSIILYSFAIFNSDKVSSEVKVRYSFCYNVEIRLYVCCVKICYI